MNEKKKMLSSFITWISRYRIILSDSIMAWISFPLALYLRLDEEVFRLSRELILMGSFYFCSLAVVVCIFFKVHKTIWRYVSLGDLIQVLKAATVSVGVFSLLLFFIFSGVFLPRSIPIIHWCVFSGFLAGTRVGYRIILEKYFKHKSSKTSLRKPVLLIYTGNETEIFLRYQQQDVESPYRIIGLLDKDHHHVERTIRGIRVLGALQDLQNILLHLPEPPEQLIVTSDEVPHWPLQKIVQTAETFGLKVVRLPFMQKNKRPEKTIIAEPIAIEDLLGRPAQIFDPATVKDLLQGKCILITGAGGSIGSELARQVASCAPRKLILFDHSEFLLYRIDRKLSCFLPHETEKVTLIGDVRDEAYVRLIIETHKPDMVFHAAALKHVPLVESNPEEGVLTNILGVRYVADACHACGVSLMVQISTDKVVLPKSIMGATKKLAEMYCQALDVVSSTRFVTVRFGNVLSSNGSVVPLFEEQIAHGGPVTVTHPDMTRYFMTIPEAVKLILVSATISCTKLAQTGQIFVLDMGTPVRVVDLANQMIRLKGLTPEKDIKIVYTGIRGGEKLHEKLFDNQETLMPSGFQGVRLASSPLVDLDTLLSFFDELTSLAKTRSGKVVAMRVMEIITTLKESSPSKADSVHEP
ncbi:MAG: polysaccharide biosynthesis protein [Holosporales bacterium]|jgi:O-antigen biosynthesis protein WbqV|nr:polysaccharide biosynthesis protein [Holosporales bacterium]